MSFNYLLYQVNIMLRRVQLEHNIRSGMHDTVETEAMKTYMRLIMLN